MKKIALALVISILFASTPIVMAGDTRQSEYPGLYWEVKLIVDQVRDPTIQASLMKELDTFNYYMRMSAQAPSTTTAIAYVAIGVKTLFHVAAVAKAVNGAANPGAMLMGLSPRFMYCRSYSWGGYAWIYCPDDKWNFRLQLACDNHFRCYPYGKNS